MVSKLTDGNIHVAPRNVVPATDLQSHLPSFPLKKKGKQKDKKLGYRVIVATSALLEQMKSPRKQQARSHCHLFPSTAKQPGALP